MCGAGVRWLELERECVCERLRCVLKRVIGY